MDEQIGRQLQTAREASGLSVDDVVFKTRLPRAVVIALEAEDFSVFPGNMYAKSFLSQYSEFLQVDARPWIDALEPVAFTPGEGIPVDRLGTHEVAAPRSSGSAWPVIGMMAVSAAVIFAAIKGFDSYESRFGGETVRNQESPPTVQAMTPVVKPLMHPKPAAAPLPSIMKEDEELGKPPPRAIPVPEWDGAKN